MQENITQIMCKFDHPEISSQYDIIFSEFTLPRHVPPDESDNLVTAPRTTIKRNKIFWSEDGAVNYRYLVSDQLI